MDFADSDENAGNRWGCWNVEFAAACLAERESARCKAQGSPKASKDDITACLAVSKTSSNRVERACQR